MQKETFILKAKAKHGEKYDYSLLDNCIKTHGKVKIICPKHGVFEQEANSHLQGRGCEKCSYEYRGANRRKSDFVERAKRIHGDKYDYSKTKYEVSNKKVTIICPIHGEFQQTPIAHLRGCGCFKCGRELTGKKKNKSQEEFLNEAKSVHGEKYLYDKVKYVNSTTKITITCPKHGDFLIYPYNFLAGKGCAKCYHEAVSKRIMLSQKDFINRCKKIHGDKYDYSKVVYKGKDSKVTIICPTHGEFEQLAGHHMRGCGCPHCLRSIGEEKIASYLKDREIDYIPQYKIKNEFIFSDRKILKVDFYLPSFKVFIEFNGEQHYRPIEYFGGEEKFLLQQERDYSLRQYCKENNIILIEIPYDKIDGIKTILDKRLKLNKK